MSASKSGGRSQMLIGLAFPLPLSRRRPRGSSSLSSSERDTSAMSYMPMSVWHRDIYRKSRAHLEELWWALVGAVKPDP